MGKQCGKFWLMVCKDELYRCITTEKAVWIFNLLNVQSSAQVKGKAGIYGDLLDICLTAFGNSFF